MPRGHLRVVGIFDLDPVGARAVAVIAAIRELAHNSLDVLRTRNLEEVPAAAAGSGLTGSVGAFLQRNNQLLGSWDPLTAVDIAYIRRSEHRRRVQIATRLFDFQLR